MLLANVGLSATPNHECAGVGGECGGGGLSGGDGIAGINGINGLAGINGCDGMNIQHYAEDHCNGVAIASALGNNHMSLATNKPQISMGLGECGGEVGGSLMLGVKAGKNTLINGSYARDEDIDSFGVGLTIILK